MTLNFVFTEARKAVAGAIAAGGGAAATAFWAAVGDGHITTDEWVTIAGSAVVFGFFGGVAVFRTTNAPAKAV